MRQFILYTVGALVAVGAYTLVGIVKTVMWAYYLICEWPFQRGLRK